MRDLQQIRQQLDQALTDLLQKAKLNTSDILVIGCSTSEIQGKKIGKASSSEIARALYPVINEKLQQHKIYPAFQGCEHINRALTIPEKCRQHYDLSPVTVVPHPEAGGAMAATAYQSMDNPVVVESIRAQAGIDIGDTFIGMHLQPVAVPVRSEIKKIGDAHLTMARTRPKLIGGPRAHYPD